MLELNWFEVDPRYQYFFLIPSVILMYKQVWELLFYLLASVTFYLHVPRISSILIYQAHHIYPLFFIFLGSLNHHFAAWSYGICSSADLVHYLAKHWVCSFPDLGFLWLDQPPRWQKYLSKHLPTPSPTITLFYLHISSSQIWSHIILFLFLELQNIQHLDSCLDQTPHHAFPSPSQSFSTSKLPPCMAK